MDFKQSVVICDLTGIEEVGRILSRVSKTYDNDNIALRYSRKKLRRSGNVVIYIIYMCDENSVLEMGLSDEDHIVLLTDDYSHIPKDIGQNIYDIILIKDLPDHLFCFRINQVINRIHAEYISQTTMNIMQSIIDSSPNMVWVKDINGRHVVLNNMFCDIVGKDRKMCINREHPDIWDISWEEYKSTDFACRKSEEEVIKTGKTGVFEENVLTHGEIKKFKTFKTPVYDNYGNTLGTCGIGHDITNLHNLDIEMSILIDNVPFPMCVCDAEKETIKVNRPFLELADVPRAEEFDYNLWREMFTEAISDKTYSEDSLSTYQEIKAETDNGICYFVATEQAVTDFTNNVTGYFCILNDVTYRKKYEEAILKLANTDPLTGLYNRRYVVDFINGCPGERFTLLYMDIDCFKEVNDRFGHKKGDEVLKQTANAIQDEYPEGICARLGGDEFIVLLSGDFADISTDKRNSNLSRKVQSLIENKGKAVISLSIGETRNCIVEDVESFINVTDQRMYAVKKAHKTSGF